MYYVPFNINWAVITGLSLLGTMCLSILGQLKQTDMRLNP